MSSVETAILPGGIVSRPGSTADYKTGTWRVKRPVVDLNKCTGCLICWIYCPEPAILKREDGKIEFDYEHCKGCGICSEECPPKAISMVEE
ncbi:MAG: ferredoxin [Candidatus Terraquivivens tikiterensis]|uniref:Ferredoxin n=1 Tax=Candidatus Terraquivivens tikiterensis TaxID=1980982 RepID=A0A2R7YAB0_9ARCH|nr:MAG: ferredoxin [Candidatus Terraquivivens tikiterensis]